MKLSGPTIFFLLVAGIVIVVFIVANAHLITVATSSQPECVPHVKADGEQRAAGSFGVAKSSC